MGKITDAEPSRFLSEIDDEYIEFLNPVLEKRFINNSGVKSNIFDEHPSEEKL
jgi:DNA helicase-2/ATP-dependent DNA helicase PcrA